MPVITSNIKAWKFENKHLPALMRTRENQEKLFQHIHEVFSSDMDKFEFNAIQGQHFIVDIFLNFMANYGYTLQKTKIKLPFNVKPVHPSINTWRHEQKHLPSFMRDFHHQKELFRTILQISSDEGMDVSSYGFRESCTYTLDVFLWFMARHGYTLQKSRQNLPFDDLIVTRNRIIREQDKLTANVLLQALSKNK
jgi:hypothetical protein